MSLAVVTKNWVSSLSDADHEELNKFERGVKLSNKAFEENLELRPMIPVSPLRNIFGGLRLRST